MTVEAVIEVPFTVRLDDHLVADNDAAKRDGILTFKDLGAGSVDRVGHIACSRDRKRAAADSPRPCSATTGCPLPISPEVELAIPAPAAHSHLPERPRPCVP